MLNTDTPAVPLLATPAYTHTHTRAARTLRGTIGVELGLKNKDCRHSVIRNTEEAQDRRCRGEGSAAVPAVMPTPAGPQTSSHGIDVLLSTFLRTTFLSPTAMSRQTVRGKRPWLACFTAMMKPEAQSVAVCISRRKFSLVIPQSCTSASDDLAISASPGDPQLMARKSALVVRCSHSWERGKGSLTRPIMMCVRGPGWEQNLNSAG